MMSLANETTYGKRSACSKRDFARGGFAFLSRLCTTWFENYHSALCAYLQLRPLSKIEDDLPLSQILHRPDKAKLDELSL